MGHLKKLKPRFIRKLYVTLVNAVKLQYKKVFFFKKKPYWSYPIAKCLNCCKIDASIHGQGGGGEEKGGLTSPLPPWALATW